MTLAEYTDQVPVLVGDLETVQAALQNAVGLAATHELQHQFLQMRRRTKPSPLAVQLQTALERVQGYLAEVDNDVE